MNTSIKLPEIIEDWSKSIEEGEIRDDVVALGHAIDWVITRKADNINDVFIPLICDHDRRERQEALPKQTALSN
jgi:hypothetical protein